jgi:hypothetical protein
MPLATQNKNHALLCAEFRRQLFHDLLPPPVLGECSHRAPPLSARCGVSSGLQEKPRLGRGFEVPQGGKQCEQIISAMLQGAARWRVERTNPVQSFFEKEDKKVFLSGFRFSFFSIGSGAFRHSP